MPAGSDPSRAARPRDPRLDVFRGLGMLIILIAHIPRNPWSGVIPARFGFSDATEIFVFCSGIASALAFGRAFDRSGWVGGAARVAHRAWQVYWAHVGVFAAIVATLGAIDGCLGTDYVSRSLNLWPFLAAPAQRLGELLTLTYVPNYFDILPMYLVILAMIPAAMAIERWLGGRTVLAVSLALWAVAALRGFELPAERWGTGRAWFFDPFAWQLLFFLGYGLVRGWAVPPSRSAALVGLSVLVLVGAAPFSCQRGWSCYAGYGLVPWLGTAHEALGSLIAKTDLGPLRIVHFLALATLANLAAGEGGARLRGLPGAELMAVVGRQTLAVFLAGLWLAQVLGVLLDRLGRDAAAVALVNVGGCAALVGVAVLVGWIKGGPWTVDRARGSERPRPADPALSPQLLQRL